MFDVVTAFVFIFILLYTNEHGLKHYFCQGVPRNLYLEKIWLKLKVI